MNKLGILISQMLIWKVGSIKMRKKENGKILISTQEDSESGESGVREKYIASL